MLLTGFKHVDTTVFFDNIRLYLLQTFRANGSRRLDDAIKSKIRARELSIRRREVDQLVWGVQFISRMMP